MIDVLGFLGAIIVLVVFFFSQVGQIKTDDVRYDAGNFLGSFLLTLYAIAGSSIPFVIVNVAWAAISFWDLVKWWRARR
jgi:cadmium resistance protein CadD (predicted permease)